MADGDADAFDLDSKLNDWNASVQRGEDEKARHCERREKKYLGPGSAKMAKSFKEMCKKMQQSKSNHDDDD